MDPGGIDEYIRDNRAKYTDEAIRGTLIAAGATRPRSTRHSDAWAWRLPSGMPAPASREAAA